ncbi:unnamed protein product [Amoebophrya sp. A120]|nr:unnamed protein product [Amoebophrya sp. A120]|eukprot:GSA120T00004760001.1
MGARHRKLLQTGSLGKTQATGGSQKPAAVKTEVSEPDGNDGVDNSAAGAPPEASVDSGETKDDAAKPGGKATTASGKEKQECNGDADQKKKKTVKRQAACPLLDEQRLKLREYHRRWTPGTYHPQWTDQCILEIPIGESGDWELKIPMPFNGFVAAALTVAGIFFYTWYVWRCTCIFFSRAADIIDTWKRSIYKALMFRRTIKETSMSIRYFEDIWYGGGAFIAHFAFFPYFDGEPSEHQRKLGWDYYYKRNPKEMPKDWEFSVDSDVEMEVKTDEDKEKKEKDKKPTALAIENKEGDGPGSAGETEGEADKKTGNELSDEKEIENESEEAEATENDSSSEQEEQGDGSTDEGAAGGDVESVTMASETGLEVSKGEEEDKDAEVTLRERNVAGVTNATLLESE